MAIIQCKGCNYKPSEHDTLAGYCMICAGNMVREYEQLQERIKELETALRQIAAIDSTNDFTDSIVDIAEKALNKNT